MTKYIVASLLTIAALIGVYTYLAWLVIHGLVEAMSRVHP